MKLLVFQIFFMSLALTSKAQDAFLQLVNKKLNENEKIINSLKIENQKLKSKVEVLLAKKSANSKKISKALSDLYQIQALLKDKEKKIADLIVQVQQQKAKNKELKNALSQLEMQLQNLKQYNQENIEGVIIDDRDGKTRDLDIPMLADKGPVPDDNNEKLNSVPNRDTSLQQKGIDNSFQKKVTTDEDEKSETPNNKTSIEKELKDAALLNRTLETRQWKARMNELAKRNDVIDITITNNCNQDIFVCLYYMDLEDNWVTQGWWSIKAYQSIEPDIKTSNGLFYSYAKSTRLTWDGKGESDSMSRMISSQNFVRIDENDQLEYLEGIEYVKFHKVYIGSYWTFGYTFNCN